MKIFKRQKTLPSTYEKICLTLWLRSQPMEPKILYGSDNFLRLIKIY